MTQGDDAPVRRTVDRVRVLASAGLTTSEIAEMTAVSRQRIHQISKRYNIVIQRAHRVRKKKVVVDGNGSS